MEGYDGGWKDYIRQWPRKKGGTKFDKEEKKEERYCININLS